MSNVSIPGQLIDCIAEHQAGLHSIIVSTPEGGHSAIVITGLNDQQAEALKPMVGKEIAVRIELAA
jgi:hypothetical protein